MDLNIPLTYECASKPWYPTVYSPRRSAFWESHGRQRGISRDGIMTLVVEYEKWA